MTHSPSPPSPRSPGRIAWLSFLVLCGLFAACGLALLVLGGQLIVAGGSWFYAIQGLLLVAVAAMLALRVAAGTLLFGITLAATLAWALWEVGLDGWALIPRLAWLAALGLLLCAFWPVVRRRFTR
ncbi:MAG: membrane-bound PQQ-dependent dehydrogenase, glucose/quinate/shikimate family, partial [Comamonadaceae bacterium]